MALFEADWAFSEAVGLEVAGSKLSKDVASATVRKPAPVAGL